MNDKITNCLTSINSLITERDEKIRVFNRILIEFQKAERIFQAAEKIFKEKKKEYDEDIKALDKNLKPIHKERYLLQDIVKKNKENEAKMAKMAKMAKKAKKANKAREEREAKIKAWPKKVNPSLKRFAEMRRITSLVMFHGIGILWPQIKFKGNVYSYFT